MRAMRTNIVIDNSLMTRAMKLAGTRTKRETVEKGLDSIRLGQQGRIRMARGKLRWRGD